MNSSIDYPIVVDASTAIWAVVPGPVDTLPLFSDCGSGDVLAPEIWLPETVSVIRRMAYGHYLTSAEALTAVHDLFSLDVQVMMSDEALALSALQWAERLGQSKAYDAFYVALAERAGADLWTADRRLVNGARQAGVTWVRWVGEMQRT